MQFLYNQQETVDLCSEFVLGWFVLVHMGSAKHLLCAQVGSGL